MRKLVTRRTVAKLMPIKGADFIELALIDGWACIVKKGEFEVGAEGIFFEIDSFLPNESRYEFLGKTKTFNGQEGFRIRTMKMRSVLSQGLLLPLSFFDEELPEDAEELQAKLAVIKYDPQTQREKSKGMRIGNAGGKFPAFLRKSDQERLQNLPHYFEIYKEHEFSVEYKADGSSLSVFKVERPKTLWEIVKSHFGFYIESTRFGVCSRNLELKRTDNFERTFNNNGTQSTYKQSDFWGIVHKLDIESRLPIGFALQGELIGPKIQGNFEKVTQNELWIFDVFDINNQEYLLPGDRAAFMQEYFPDLMQCPMINPKVKLFEEFPDLDSLQRYVQSVSGHNLGVKFTEGLVFKSLTVPGLTFKLINNQYLLKYEE